MKAFVSIPNGGSAAASAERRDSARGSVLELPRGAGYSFVAEVSNARIVDSKENYF